MKLGLQNVQRLQQLLNFPDRAYKTIHVAGTNGKGSVSTKIALTFEEAGYRVGLYTSPHLSCFRERIKINGVMIPEAAVFALLSSLFDLTEKEDIPATFFELTTFLAFVYFAQEKVDIVILETGLGGRLDATNIVKPILSVITSISLDHTEILGLTPEAIAWEKGGIIKENVPVVIGPKVPYRPIEILARQKGSPILKVRCKTSLYEEENKEIALTSLNFLSTSFCLPPEAIEKGLQGRQPCRFEVIKLECPVILDVAHNPDGLDHLFKMCSYYFPNQPLSILFGISKSKDIDHCLEIITKNATSYHLVEALNGRGLPIDDLHEQLNKKAPAQSNIFKHTSITNGVHFAKLNAAKNNKILVICGSFFIMNEVRKALGFIEPSDNMDLNEKNKFFINNMQN